MTDGRSSKFRIRPEEKFRAARGSSRVIVAITPRGAVSKVPPVNNERIRIIVGGREGLAEEIVKAVEFCQVFELLKF